MKHKNTWQSLLAVIISSKDLKNSIIFDCSMKLFVAHASSVASSPRLSNKIITEVQILQKIKQD